MPELKPEDLGNHCKCDKFKFSTTDEVPTLINTVGQDRGIKAIQTGLGTKSDGFNIFITGPTGTGRNSTIKALLLDLAKQEKVPNDWCYVHNFSDPNKPSAISLNSGEGIIFSKDMRSFVNIIKNKIPKAFESEQYESQRDVIVNKVNEKSIALSKEINIIASKLGFQVNTTPTGVFTIPMIDGKTITQEEYQKLPDEKKNEIEKNRQTLQNDINATIKKSQQLEKELRDNLIELDKKIGLFVINGLIDDLKNKHSNNKNIISYLNQVKEDIINNIGYFKEDQKGKKQQSPLSMYDYDTKYTENYFQRYTVNLIIDNSTTEGAPVIFESNPNYYNLFGSIEYKQEFGIWNTDLTLIRTGSLLKANGGYIVMQAMDLLSSPFTWENLKRSIKNKKITIENLEEQVKIIPTVSVKPEPIPISVKVILIGSSSIYSALFEYDEDFRKLFKIRSQFDYEMERNNETEHLYASFIASRCKESNSKINFSSEAISSVVEYGSKLAGDKYKLTTQFSNIVDIVNESIHWAAEDKSKIVKKIHVMKTLNEKKYRSNLLEEKIHEMINNESIRIEISGKRIRQINGLSVISTGEYEFGRPSRITATCALGKGNVINIEKESKLSGPIFDKGVLILSSFLSSKYSHNKPFPVTITLCFEQNYEGVEGDSASAAELYAILSVIGKIPLRQDIAITGSVDQLGNIQPIGGVNFKIEGFFDICNKKGLTGTQGVIIPVQNVRNLMLKEEVIQAVKDHKFHIYSISKIEEGIEILTGLKSGELNTDGTYQAKTINRIVSDSINEYINLVDKYSEKKKEKKK